ncbi:uncharacterized protein G2W53_026789 [Senna tora]|uniref:DRBM domain-containing protein n=1 Tax=Senna tora TaxID=362788 RepID=A0A834THU2_9FABA|nr:uncharacterized protein G2W53_026789 [Senna tora]
MENRQSIVVIAQFNVILKEVIETLGYEVPTYECMKSRLDHELMFRGKLFKDGLQGDELIKVEGQSACTKTKAENSAADHVLKVKPIQFAST